MLAPANSPPDTPEPQGTFGANLRHYRKAKGLTQTGLEEKVGLSLDMIGRLERGLTAPPFETIEKLANVRNIPEPALFGPNLMALPTGERGRLIKRINVRLSRMKEDELAQAERVLEALGCADIQVRWQSHPKPIIRESPQPLRCQ